MEAFSKFFSSLLSRASGSTSPQAAEARQEPPPTDNLNQEEEVVKEKVNNDEEMPEKPMSQGFEAPGVQVFVDEGEDGEYEEEYEGEEGEEEEEDEGEEDEGEEEPFDEFRSAREYFASLVDSFLPPNSNEFFDFESRISQTSPRKSLEVSQVTSNGLMEAFQEVNPSLVGPILEFLSPQDLCSLACVSKRWKEESSHNMYWRKHFTRIYNLPIPEDRRFEPGFIKRLFAECTPRVGDLLEVVDTVHKWVVCRVIAVLNRTQFLVYFEGWSVAYIMWVDKIRDSQRIRPIHPKHLTGLGAMGSIKNETFKFLTTESTRVLQAPVTTWPIPPCNYLPCLYYNDLQNLVTCNLKITVRDPTRLRRLQAPREAEFVPTEELQTRMPPLWMGNYPFESTDPFYGPGSRATHAYYHDPYPGEGEVPTPHELMAYYLTQFGFVN